MWPAPSDGAIVSSKGCVMPGIPAWTYALRASRDFKFGEKVDATINAGLRYMDDSVVVDDSSFGGTVNLLPTVTTALSSGLVSRETSV